MAKKQLSKSKNPSLLSKIKQLLRKYWALGLALVLLITLLGVMGANKLAIADQKRQFDTAEKSLDTLYAEIVKEVGQPTSVQKESYCSYSSVELGRGKRVCSVGYIAIFEKISTKDASRNFAKQIEQSLILRGVEIIGKGVAHEDSPADSARYSSSDDFEDSKSGMKCYASYGFDPQSTTAMHGLAFSVRCYGYPDAEFYPVKN